MEPLVELRLPLCQLYGDAQLVFIGRARTPWKSRGECPKNLREARQREVKPIEARLPAIYLDVLDLAAYTLDKDSSTEFRKLLMTVYLHRYATGEYPAANLRKARESAQAEYRERRGGSHRRLSLKVTQRVADDLLSLTATTEMSRTDVLKSVIFQIQSDVLETRKPALLRELSTLALLAA